MLRHIGELFLFLGIFGALFLLMGPSQFLLSNNGVSVQLRKVQEELSSHNRNKNKKQTYEKIPMSCKIPELQVPQKKVQPMFMTTYPGSGTRLQWELVEALTGIVTTDDAFSNGHHNVIGIKTHFPCPAGREFPGAESVLRAMIFVRHPMDTLPAYHDIIYASEQNNINNNEGNNNNNEGEEHHHQQHAPLEAWIEWRDLSFARELEIWRKHFVYWMERYSDLNRLVVPYEKLIDRGTGPKLVLEMSDFLKQSLELEDGIAAKRSDVPCVWQKIMNKVFSQGGANMRLRRARRRVRRRLLFRATQQEQSHTTTTRRRLQALLQPAANLALMPGPQLLTPEQQQQLLFQQQQPALAGTLMDPSSLLLQQQPQLEQTAISPLSNVAAAQVPLDPSLLMPKLGGAMAEADPEMVPHMLEQPQAQVAAVGGEEGGETTTPVDPSAEGSVSTDEVQQQQQQQQEQSSLVEGEGQEQQTDDNHDEKKSSGGDIMGMIEAQLRNQNNKKASGEDQDDNDGSADDNNNNENDDNDNNYRPYTEGQRKEIVIVLAQLLEKYRDDEVLTPILVEYIDQVEQRQGEAGAGER